VKDMGVPAEAAKAPIVRESYAASEAGRDLGFLCKCMLGALRTFGKSPDPPK